jgi:NAD-dependent deacetylase
MKRIAVLTGAGISAESGVKTFRDAGGLWEGHDVMEVASIDGWHRNNLLVLDFYNARRRQLKEVFPNRAHELVAKLEEKYHVDVVTQNVDDLHERAGSTSIIHLHGELLKVRGENSPRESIFWEGDLLLGDLNDRGEQLRPAIVWFGEDVPLIQKAAEIVYDADIIIIIGTSMQVYPAAGLVSYAQPGSLIYYIDANPAVNHDLKRLNNLKVMAMKASEGMDELYGRLVMV